MNCLNVILKNRRVLRLITFLGWILFAVVIFSRKEIAFQAEMILILISVVFCVTLYLLIERLKTENVSVTDLNRYKEILNTSLLFYIEEPLTNLLPTKPYEELIELLENVEITQQGNYLSYIEVLDRLSKIDLSKHLLLKTIKFKIEEAIERYLIKIRINKFLIESKLHYDKDMTLKDVYGDISYFEFIVFAHNQLIILGQKEMDHKQILLLKNIFGKDANIKYIRVMHTPAQEALSTEQLKLHLESLKKADNSFASFAIKIIQRNMLYDMDIKQFSAVNNKKFTVTFDSLISDLEIVIKKLNTMSYAVDRLEQNILEKVYHEAHLTHEEINSFFRMTGYDELCLTEPFKTKIPQKNYKDILEHFECIKFKLDFLGQQRIKTCTHYIQTIEKIYLR